MTHFETHYHGLEHYYLRVADGLDGLEAGPEPGAGPDTGVVATVGAGKVRAGVVGPCDGP